VRLGLEVEKEVTMVDFVFSWQITDGKRDIGGFRGAKDSGQRGRRRGDFGPAVGLIHHLGAPKGNRSRPVGVVIIPDLLLSFRGLGSRGLYHNRCAKCTAEGEGFRLL
jgi:hypothetical protein